MSESLPLVVRPVRTGDSGTGIVLGLELAGDDGAGVEIFGGATIGLTSSTLSSTAGGGNP